MAVLLSIRRRSTVRSGQVRVFMDRTSCCSARLSLAQVPSFTGSSDRDREKKGEGLRGGTACTGGYKGVQAVRQNLWYELIKHGISGEILA